MHINTINMLTVVGTKLPRSGQLPGGYRAFASASLANCKYKIHSTIVQMETQNLQSVSDDLTVVTSSQQQSSNNTTSSNNPNLIELNETVSRIASHSGVEIVQILNMNGDIMAECNNMRSVGKTPTATSIDNNTITPEFNETIIQNTANSSTTNKINSSISTASTARKLLQTAQIYIQQLNDDESNDEITFIEIRSKNGYELMIAPHYGFALVVIKRS
jgi:hypothetical protein